MKTPQGAENGGRSQSSGATVPSIKKCSNGNGLTVLSMKFLRYGTAINSERIVVGYRDAAWPSRSHKP